MSVRKRKTQEEEQEGKEIVHVMRPGRNGGKLRSGNPGSARHGGRPPKRFRNWCRKMLSREMTTRSVRKILNKGDKSTAFSGTYNTLAKYGYNDLTKQSDLKLKAGGELLDLLHEAALTQRKAKPKATKK